MMPKLPEPDGWFFTEEGRLAETGQYEKEAVRAIQEEAYRAGMAAERERCANIVDVPAGLEAWEIVGGSEGINMLRELADKIRGSQEVK